jgi:hypothetical protein
MKKNTLNKTYRMSKLGLVGSLIFLLIMRLIIGLLFYYNVDSEMGEKVYGICYILGFVSLFALLFFFVLFIFQLIKNKYFRQ